MKWALIILLIFPYQNFDKKQKREKRVKPDYAAINKNLDLLMIKIDSLCLDSLNIYPKDTIYIDTNCLFL